MYLQYYGLTHKPFDLVPDPRFLYVSKKHDLALAHLEYGIMDNKGLICLTGEVGTGKTTLIHHLLGKIESQVNSALIVNPSLDPEALLEVIAKQLALYAPGDRKAALYEKLHTYLLAQCDRNRRTVLVIDEAQNMPQETLEEVRLLSNLQTEESHLIQIILVGQPEFQRRIQDPRLSQLAQRISVFYHLAPLEEHEVKGYIDHRLAVAGYRSKDPLFSDEAVRRVYEYSHGVPRIINALCDAALMYGYATEIRPIGPDVIERVFSDRSGTLRDSSEESPAAPSVSLPETVRSGVCPEHAALQNTLSEISREIKNLHASFKEVHAMLKAVIDLTRTLYRIPPPTSDPKVAEENRQLKERVALLSEHYRKLWNRYRQITRQAEKDSGKAGEEGEMASFLEMSSLEHYCRKLLTQNRNLRHRLERITAARTARNQERKEAGTPERRKASGAEPPPSRDNARATSMPESNGAHTKRG